MWYRENIIDWTKFRRSVRNKVDEYSKYQTLTPDVIKFVLSGAVQVAANTPVHSSYRLLALAARTQFAGVGPFELSLDTIFSAAPYMERAAVFLSGFNPVNATKENVELALASSRVKLSDRLSYHQHPNNPAWRVHCWFGEPEEFTLPASSFDLYMRKALNVLTIAVEAHRRNLPIAKSLSLAVLFRHSRHPLDLNPVDWCASWAPNDWCLPFSFGDWSVRGLMIPHARLPQSIISDSRDELAVAHNFSLTADTAVSQLYVVNLAAKIRQLREALRNDSSMEVGIGNQNR